MRGTVRYHPAAGQVPPRHARVPEGDVARVGQLGVGALPVPHLPACVPGVLHDGGDCAQRPSRSGPVRVAAGVGRGRARHPGLIQRPRDPRDRMPGQAPGEDPPHHMRGRRVGLQPVRAPPPRGVCLVRVRPRIREPVPVRRTAAQVPALLTGLGGHRGADPRCWPG